MNKYFYRSLMAIIAFSALAIFGSCKKYLEQLPITAVGSELVFKDVETTKSALAGVYQQLAGDDGYGLKLSLYFAVGEDITYGPTNGPDAGRRDFPMYATQPSNGQMSGPYNKIFKGIQYANVCIANIPAMEMYKSGTDQQKKQLQRMYGEALSLRAQFYFEAIRNWGDLPLHFQPAEVLAVTDPFPKRIDRDTIYDRILADLKTAEDLVPWRSEVTSIGDPVDERLTQGAVRGLRARIALFRGGYSLRQDGTIKRSTDYKAFYQIALDETSEIIRKGDHGLNPSFKNLWKNQVGSRVVSDPHGELMFQVTAAGKLAASDAKVGFNSGPTVVDESNRTATTGTASVFILPTFFYYFDSTDQRRDVTCVAYNDTALLDGVTFNKRGQQITSIFDGKYRRDWLNPNIGTGNYANNYTGYKWQILRYSDVLLMYAEAQNELNSPSAASPGCPTATQCVAQVNLRGHGGAYAVTSETPPVIPTDKDGFFKFLVRERALELAGEGIRKYDLIRWNLLDQAIRETKANLTKMGATLTNPAPTYMAPPPSYVISPIGGPLPAKLYFRNRSSSDDLNVTGGLIVNSLYRKEPTSTPTGTYSVNWITLANIQSIYNPASPAGRYAGYFVTGKSELMPIPADAITAYGSFASNFPQNPNY